MQQYTRLSTPRFRRFTIRFSGIEIEFRSRPEAHHARPSRGELALRRARVDEAVSRHRHEAWLRWSLHS